METSSLGDANRRQDYGLFGPAIQLNATWPGFRLCWVGCVWSQAPRRTAPDTPMDESVRARSETGPNDFLNSHHYSRQPTAVKQPASFLTLQ